MDNLEEELLIQQPEEILTPLYKHQLASIYQMEKREKEQCIYIDYNIINLNIGIQSDKTGYGKCLGLNTPIIMFNGEIKMVQDIQVNELVMGDDSSSRRITSLARGEEIMYKIIQEGDNFIVNQSHILSLKMCHYKYIIGLKVFTFDPDKIIFNVNTFKSLNESINYFDNIPYIDTRIDISVEQYLNLDNNIRTKLRGYKNSVNCWENNLQEEYDLDPYIFGLWLGNNTISKDDNISEIVLKYFYNIKSIKEIKTFFERFNLLNNKHIPLVYKANTITNRLKLLAGLLDVDGVIKENIYEIKINNKRLLNDIQFLCRSLGFTCSLKSCFPWSEKGFNSILLSGDNLHIIPILQNNSIIKNEYNLSNNICTEIEIEYLGVNKYYGFTLDKNRRFLLGDFTVTHNTLSLVTLIYRNNMSWDMNTLYIQSQLSTICDGNIKKTVQKYHEKLDITLVLAGNSIINQWYDECKKSPLCVKKITTKKDVDTVLIINYDVILITPSMYNTFVLKYSNMAWKRFIYDEPGNIKVPAMKNIIAGFYWLVTATPSAILTKNKQCKNTFMNDLCSYTNFNNYINHISIKNNDTFLDESFKMTPTKHLYYKCYNPVYKATHGFVSYKISEMISAGNIAGAIKELGGGSTQNITELIKNKKIQEIKDLESIIDILKIRNKEKQTQTYIEKVNRLKLQIEELNNRYKNILEGECNICLLKIKNPVMEPNCQNIFCGECLLTWLKIRTTCPLCRENVQQNKLIHIDNDNINSTYKLQKEKKLTKIDTILKIIQDNTTGKFIIYSAWDQTFQSILNMLFTNNISYIEVKGCVTTRQKNINSFKKGNISVILLNSENNGSGINLQEASDLIIYHDMDVPTENQIIGRANRIGRLESLKVHHLQI